RRSSAGDGKPQTHGAPRILRGEALMILLLTVLTLAEITRTSSAAAATRCSVPSVVSHRGDRSAGLENTLTAFGRTLDAGSAGVEFDVRFTKDHHPVLMHDATVDRTTTGSGRVAAMTLTRFRTLRTGDGQHPPTLGQALALLRGRVSEALVELKQIPDAADLRALHDAYRRQDAFRWANLASFSPMALRAVDSIPARKGLVTRSAPSVALAGTYAFVAVRYDRLTRARVRAYRNAGVAVYAWTPNNRDAWRRLAGYGVTRILTDQSTDYLAWARGTCRS
ncbi:glycerophosphodiester phosphodiesterase, partial [Streptosporangium sp. NPDC005286]|uniref:glycerophosphodiester phosphodiesterase n=1 Tax=Streptosporangium sp. NPDC005286 TaxID=3154463 RepID=UPI0033A2CF3A